MKIAIPTVNGRLCAHFGHCESFTFADVNENTKEIKNIETKIPQEGISCKSASWIAQQGIDVVLAGGMGMRPLQMFLDNGIRVISGCPELEIETLLKSYLEQTLVTGENSCSGEHHHCHGNGEGHCHNH